MLESGLRSTVNLKNDRVGYKIRESSLQKHPYALVVGGTEEENQSVNVRSRDKGDLGEITLSDLIRTINLENDKKA